MKNEGVLMKRGFWVVLCVGLLLGVASLVSAQVGPCYNNPDVGVSNTNNCNLHSGRGIGLTLEQEFKVIRAVDIFENDPEKVVAVCLRGDGGLLYSRADILPRVAHWAWYYTTNDGFVCTNVNRPGVVVLISDRSPFAAGNAIPAANPAGSAGGAAAAPTPSAAAAAFDSGTRIELTNCNVVTRAILNFRDAPSPNSNVKDLIPYRLILRAIARQGNWFNVIYGSDNGWVSANLVNTRGSCGGR